uniref:Acidic repeat-containing protein n=1 Tax=Geotrypetes seraphini TaxID=260995 RepID=A0A6P8QX11_GEOSA|nr:acidic repeat-containing protein [Geotrypetes seraphini]
MDVEMKSLFDRVSHRLVWERNGDQLKQNVIKNKTCIQPTLLKSNLAAIDGAEFESCFQQLHLSDSDSGFLRGNNIKSSRQKQQWTMTETPKSNEQKGFSMTLITKEANERGIKVFLGQETSTTTRKNNRLPEDRTIPVLPSKSDEDLIIKSYLYESCKDKPKGEQEYSNLRPDNTYSGSSGKQKVCTDRRLNSYSHLDWEKDFKEPAICSSTNLMLQNDAVKISESSDDEFDILMEKVKNRTKPQTPRSTAKKVLQPRLTSKDLESFISPSEDVGCSFEETKKLCIPKPKSLSKIGIATHKPLSEWNPKMRSVSCSEQISSDPWSVSCQVPGCFLQELSNPASAFVKNFKHMKEELARKLYLLYNSSIFNQELPEKMEITWNKNMRKSAGYCVTGQQKDREMLRYAKIELSEKVCDSADRLRDTLIHEICHAATWLINGIRDGHGQFWKFYAKKSSVVHPELPVVSRCHSYEIKYKFTYICSHCGTTIGRHSKSLDTQRFVCALCQGKLVLQSTHKDGTLTKTQLTPFTKSIKENDESSRKIGQNHSKLMRKLSAEFAASKLTPDS